MKSAIIGFAVACMTMTTCASAGAPTQPVTAIVGYAAGGTADIVMRQLAALMQPKFPAGLIVLNKPGAGGSTALAGLSQSKPDGLQFAFAPNSNVALSPQVVALPYKNPDDFDHVIEVVSFSPVLLVAASSKYKNVADLIAEAKTASGKVSVGFPGVTTVSHFSAVSLERATGASLIEVPFAGWGQGGPQLLGGQITSAIAQPPEAIPQITAGTLRAIGSFSEQRQGSLPTVPTFKEQGYPISFLARYLVVMPKGTPPQASKYLHDAVKEALETTQFKEFAKERGLEVTYRDGEAAKKASWADYRNYAELLKQVGPLK